MPIQLQTRDFMVFKELGSCRFLTLIQIAELCFDGRREAAKKRLQKLQHGGLILRHSFGILASSVYRLSAQGFALAKSECSEVLLPSVPALTTLKHETVLRDFRTAVFRDSKVAGVTIPTFSLNPKNLRFEIGNAVLQSDAYFEVGAAAHSFRFFVEVDLGTEPHSELLKKVGLYHQLLKSRLHALRLSSKNERIRSFPFRILFVFCSNKRCHIFLKKLSDLGLKQFVLASSLETAFIKPFNFKNPDLSLGRSV